MHTRRWFLLTLAVTLGASGCNGGTTQVTSALVPAPSSAATRPAGLRCGARDAELRLDQLQLRGSHNSYHQAPAIALHASHRYSHATLATQLERLFVRVLELDVHLEDGVLDVYHIAGIDSGSSCERFTDCLAEIRAWSDRRPCHLPLIVWVEPKSETGGDSLADPSVIDRDILSIFPPDRLLRPDDVRGDHGSLRAALEARGWPTLASARGRVVFVLLDRAGKTRAYTRDFTGLEGRAMFANAEPPQFDERWAAFAKIDDPTAAATIGAAIERRIMVGSNVCAAGRERSECATRLLHGLRNGVHMLKDDFPGPTEERDWSLRFPNDAPFRCNPVTGADTCREDDLDENWTVVSHGGPG